MGAGPDWCGPDWGGARLVRARLGRGQIGAGLGGGAGAWEAGWAGRGRRAARTGAGPEEENSGPRLGLAVKDSQWGVPGGVPNSRAALYVSVSGVLCTCPYPDPLSLGETDGL